MIIYSIDVPIMEYGEIREGYIRVNIDAYMSIEEFTEMQHYKEIDMNRQGVNLGEIKLIFNDPATILFVNGKKYVAKAHDEEFDCEKGALVCLMKSFGISHLDLKRILKNAKNQKKNSAVEKFKDISKEIENIKNDNPNNNIASIDINGITYTVNKTALTKVYTKEPSRSYPPEEYTEPKTILISPKGRHRGQPFKFMVGDKCIVRDCNYYKYTTNAKAKECLNQIFTITEDKSDFAGSMYVVNGIEFSGAELEPVKD